MDYKETLRDLTDREKKILEGKCNNLKDKDIWEKLFISEAQYYIDKGNIYSKLGLKQIKSTKERLAVLQTTICPIFFTLGESPKEEIPVEESKTIEVLQLPAIIDRKSYELAVEDGKKELTTFPPPTIVIEKTPFWLYILIGLMVLVIGYLLWTRKPSTTIVVTATPNQQMTQTALAIPVIPPTSTSTLTSTPTITFTPSPTIIPTDTLVPTDTETPTSTPDYYMQGENYEIQPGVFLVLRTDFDSSSFVGCSNFDGYNIVIDVHNQSAAQYILRFKWTDFTILDNNGKNYSVVSAGIDNCHSQPGVMSKTIDAGHDDDIEIAIPGPFDVDTQYLTITALNISGVGPIKFRKKI